MTVANLSQCIAHHRYRSKDRLAVVHGERRLTFEEFDDTVSAMAAGLHDRGLRPGQLLGVLASNSAEFLALIFAANRLGAVSVPLNWRLAPSELSYVLEHSGIVALVVSPEFHDLATASIGPDSAVSLLISTGDAPAHQWVELTDVVAAGAGSVYPDHPASVDDVHRILYTSGTTSRPKGVMLTHGNVLFNVLGQVVELELSAADRIMVSAPLFHVSGGDVPGIAALYVGATLVVTDSYKAADIVDLIEREQVTGLILAAQIINDLLQLDLTGRDLSSLRFIIFGGLAIPTYERLQAKLPHVRLIEAYGMTELCNGGAYLDAAHVGPKTGSMGRPFMHLDTRVVDTDLDDVPVGTAGELLVRGLKVSPGYWRDDEVTAASRVDGWFRTGDIVRRDADGYLWYVDRAKDMIKSGGENVAGAEVERVILQHPAVAEAAVVGGPDPKWTEVPVAFVVLRPGIDATVDELAAHCAEHLAKFKRPAVINIVDDLPRNDSGKVVKRELREQLHRETTPEDTL